VAFFVWWNNDTVVVNDDNPVVSGNVGSITGLECDGHDRRPIAVMFASDPVARPLYGLSKADIVFEMPVTPDGVTRMMAVFQCEYPDEMGSIRSARDAFITLAASIQSIFVHWGGEKNALEKLDEGIIDNIDALKYEKTVFYRRAQILPPHNGFTDMKRILDVSEDLEYDFNNSFGGYPHKENIGPKNLGNLTKTIFIDYNAPYDVRWTYNEKEGYYVRDRGRKTEIDGANGDQITADVVILMDAKSKALNIDYLDVDIGGEGDARIYQGGIVISGTWVKDRSDIFSKLYFYDKKGDEVEFLPGKIWVEINTRI
jgi:hypothetical protein